MFGMIGRKNFSALRLIVLAAILICLGVGCEAANSDSEIFVTKGAQIVPVEKLRPTEKFTAAEIASAKKAIELARDGKKLIAPLDVIERGDGSYVIMDGNKIFAAAKELGIENFPVIVHVGPYQKNVKTMKDLYALNVPMEDEFNSLMKNLQAEYGGELTKRPHIKKEARVREKTKNDYNGDYSRVTDMFAASLIYPDEKSLLATFNKIKNRDDVIKIRDRWHKPTVDGYRDIQLNILLSNGAICELQLHHAATMLIRDTIDHPLYVFTRSNKNNSAMTAYVERAQRIQRTAYSAVYDGNFSSVTPEDKKRLEDAAAKVPKQKSLRMIELLLSRMEKILEYSLDAEKIAA